MDDLSLNFQMIGDGPPLLLVHGFGISFEIWKTLAPLLRPHFTLVMVELPGIGKSPMARADYLSESVNALERLRISLGFDKWDLLGYSTGSRIAESYVQMFAPHVGRAIFLSPMFVDWLKIVGLRFGFWIDGFFPAAGTFLLRGWRLRFFIAFFGFNLQPNPHTEEWHKQINEVPVNILKETLKMISRLGLKPFSAPVPFTVIWGDADLIPARPRKWGPHDYFVKSNHAAPIVAAGEVAEVVLKVLKK